VFLPSKIPKLKFDEEIALSSVVLLKSRSNKAIFYFYISVNSPNTKSDAPKSRSDKPGATK
jgi:hypothetical protein